LIERDEQGQRKEKKETYTVLDPVAPLAQDIVLQVQQLEPGEHVLYEVADLHRAVVVAQRDRVDCETGLGFHVSRFEGEQEAAAKAAERIEEAYQLLDHRDQREEVLLDREVEGVLSFEVDGDWRTYIVS